MSDPTFAMPLRANYLLRLSEIQIADPLTPLEEAVCERMDASHVALPLCFRSPLSKERTPFTSICQYQKCPLFKSIFSKQILHGL